MEQAPNNGVSLDWNSALVAGSNLLGQGLNAFVVSQSKKQDRKFMREMYEKQKQDALEMWNMNNAYNSPEQQLARIKAAGLNPNLIYGNGVVGNSSSQAQALNAPNLGNTQVPHFDLSSAISSYFDTQIKKATLDNINADTQKKESERVKNLTDTEGLQLDNEQKRMYNEVYNANMEALKREPYLRNAYTDAQISNISENTVYLGSMIGLNTVQTQILNKQLLELGEKITLLQKQQKLTDAEIIESFSRAALNKANAYKAYNEAELAKVKQGTELFSQLFILANTRKVSNEADVIPKEFDLKSRSFAFDVSLKQFQTVLSRYGLALDTYKTERSLNQKDTELMLTGFKYMVETITGGSNDLLNILKY